MHENNTKVPGRQGGAPGLTSVVLAQTQEGKAHSSQSL